MQTIKMAPAFFRRGAILFTFKDSDGGGVMIKVRGYPVTF